MMDGHIGTGCGQRDFLGQRRHDLVDDVFIVFAERVGKGHGIDRCCGGRLLLIVGDSHGVLWGGCSSGGGADEEPGGRDGQKRAATDEHRDREEKERREREKRERKRFVWEVKDGKGTPRARKGKAEGSGGVQRRSDTKVRFFIFL